MENIIIIQGAGSGSGQTRAARQRAAGRKGGKNPFKAGSLRASNYSKIKRAQATVNANPGKKNTAARNLLRANKVSARSGNTDVKDAASSFKTPKGGTPRRTTRG